MKNLMANIIFMMTILASSNAFATQIELAKMEYTYSSPKNFIEYSSVFATDGSEVPGFHECSSLDETYLIGTNQQFKHVKLGKKNIVKFPATFNSGKHRKFFSLEIELINRDYFSNIAVLKPTFAALQRLGDMGVSFNCAGLPATGANVATNKIRGYEYYVTNYGDYRFSFRDRGLNGALVVNGNVPVGFLGKKYFFFGKKDAGLEPFNFGKAANFIRRVKIDEGRAGEGKQANSMDGMMTYIPNEELFAAWGATQAFVWQPMN